MSRSVVAHALHRLSTTMLPIHSPVEGHECVFVPEREFYKIMYIKKRENIGLYHIRIAVLDER